MSYLKRKLNKTADAEFEENGSKLVEQVQSKINSAINDLSDSFELADSNLNFKKYLDSKEFDGTDITNKILNLSNELEDLNKILKEAINMAEY